MSVLYGIIVNGITQMVTKMVGKERVHVIHKVYATVPDAGGGGWEDYSLGMGRSV